VVAQYPSAQNTFVKDHAASGNMVVDFSRNPKEFAVSDYTQLVPTEKKAGYYLEMTVEEAGRILNTDLSDVAWPDNQDAPEDFDGTESFEFKGFRCERKKFGFRLGDLTVDQASWDIVAQHGSIHAQRAMTGRTQLAITALTTTTNYAAAHTSDVASIAGNTGKWSASTTARQDIRRSLNHAANRIRLDTLGSIKPKDLILVISPGCAKEIAETQEIQDFIKGSPSAWASVKGDLADQNQNVAYGLPPQLYGYNLVVEDAAKVTSRKGATKVAAWVLDDARPFMCARPGGLEGTYGAPSFSTCSVFMLEEMTVETLHDPNNRLVRGRVVEDYVVVLTAPVSGFLFTLAV
jgi:hypothetical protein